MGILSPLLIEEVGLDSSDMILRIDGMEVEGLEVVA